MKHIHFLPAIFALAFGLTACEDVPAPYEVNSESDEESDVILEESFSTSLGDFSAINTVGSYSWAVSYSCAQVTSYVNSTNNEADSWLVSPQMDFTDVDSAYVNFSYILRYANSSELSTNYLVLVSSDFAGYPAQANWTALDFTPVNGSDWDTWYDSGNLTIPDEFMGQESVTLALRYIAETKSATWEVKNLTVNRGSGDADEEEEEAYVHELPYSESFSTSLGDFVNYTTDGEGGWTIDYSAATATGYDSSSGETTAGTFYLVSPEISLADQTSVHITYDYILRYNKSDENQALYITTDFDETDASANWTLLYNSHTQGSDWSTFYSADVSVPSEYLGQTVRVAFRYYTNSTSGSTWEIQNFCIEEGEGTTSDEESSSEVKTLPYSETFSSSLGDFESYLTSGSGSWEIDYSTAYATGYSNYTTTAGTFYLVSPEISLEGETSVHVTYSYILRYNVADEDQALYITTDFDESDASANWTLLYNSHTEGSDWSTFSSADIDIPSEYLGQTVRVAFRYVASGSSCSTWEVKNFCIESNDESDDDSDSTVDSSDSNGGFETWSGSTPTNWETTSTAGNATLSQSTDAHSGNYSVEVTGSSSANKRLGYKETTYPAGTYTLTFYAKAATSDGGSVRPGYVPVTDGSVGSYVYGDYTNDLSTSSWTYVEHSFTISAETTLCIVIMNSKSPGANVLIDDVTLTDDSGTVYISY